LFLSVLSENIEGVNSSYIIADQLYPVCITNRLKDLKAGTSKSKMSEEEAEASRLLCYIHE